MKKLHYLFSFLLLSFSASFAQTITTVVGMGVAGNAPDGTQATSALVGLIHNVAVDRQGALYFVDLNSKTIRKVTEAGTLTTVAIM